MSHFATPFVIVNLGCEMCFVIDQRLKAQTITTDKSERVLTDIVTVLLHPKLLDELFIPQPVATHSVTKQLLQDISTASIMKLDDYSMSKLWDLMTMIFKWQLSVATNQSIFDITRRHLRSVATLMPQYFPKTIIDQTLRRFDLLARRITDEEYASLSNTIILWFSEYHTKISVLMRLGLQKKDGTFSLPATVNPNILHNLGENIYKYDMKKNPLEYESRLADTNEINCLLASMDAGSCKNKVELQLPIEFGQKSAKKTLEISEYTDVRFEVIDTNVKARNTDLTFNPDIPKSPKEDLLAMLGDVEV